MLLRPPEGGRYIGSDMAWAKSLVCWSMSRECGRRIGRGDFEGSFRQSDIVSHKALADSLVIVFSFGEDRILDRAADPEREGQLAVYQFASGQTAEGVGEEALLSGDLRDAAIVERVRAGNTDTAGAINIDAVAIDVDLGAGNAQIGELQVGGNKIKRRRSIFGGAEIVEMHQLHQKIG